MTCVKALLLLTTAGCIFIAGSAHAEAAFDTSIATAGTTLASFDAGIEPELIARSYPARYARKRREPLCSGEMSFGVQRGYLYRYHGMDVANGQPTSQAVAKASCGDFAIEAGGSTLLSDGQDGIPAALVTQTATGTGSERLANEAWVILSYRPTVDTPIGRFNLEGSVVYRALDHGQRVFSTRDDYTELVARIGYPITWGPVVIEPYLRSTKANPVGYNNSLYWMAEGVKVDWQYSEDLSFNLEAACDHNVNSVTAVVHRNVCYGSVGARKQLAYDGWSIAAGMHFSQYAGYDQQFDFVVERDGRLLKSRKLATEPESDFEYYPYLSVTKRF